MNEIMIDEAIERLKKANPYLYAEVIITLGFDEYKEKSSVYESNGCIIIKLWSYHNDFYGDVFWWYLCDTGDSDISEAATDFKCTFGDNIKINQVFFLGDIPSDYDMSINAGTQVYLRLGGIGNPYIDPDIRLLSENDSEQLISLATLDDDNFVGSEKICTRYFLKYEFSQHEQLLGIFDGKTLAGAISVLNYNMELGRIINIMVSRKYRGRKYATRLIRAALALYPDLKYDYDCTKSNIASEASAKSAGFIVAGTHIPS